MSDWANHLSTIFPEVRLKRYLEMRGSDGGPWRRLSSLPALWVGLLYDDNSLAAAWDLVKYWSAEQRQKLRDDVPKLGFAARIGNRTVFEIAREVLSLSRAGLEGRNRRNISGLDESCYLEPLEDLVERGITPAQELLQKFNNDWRGSVEPIFDEYAY